MYHTLPAAVHHMLYISIAQFAKKKKKEMQYVILQVIFDTFSEFCECKLRYDNPYCGPFSTFS